MDEPSLTPREQAALLMLPKRWASAAWVPDNFRRLVELGLAARNEGVRGRYDMFATPAGEDYLRRNRGS